MKLPRAELKKARIEIIPMIDAIFFLLVFFMMTSLTLVQLNSDKVNLPESSTVQIRPEGEKVVVTLTKDAKFFVDQQQVGEPQIVPLLTQRINKNPQITVIINCDRTQTITQFSRVFDLVKQANPVSVMLAATPKSPDQLPATPSPQ